MLDQYFAFIYNREQDRSSVIVFKDRLKKSYQCDHPSKTTYRKIMGTDLLSKGDLTMPLLKSDYYTTQDIFNLPDDKRAELIDGEMYMMAPPSSAHQILVMGLSAAFFNHIQKNGGSSKVLPAPFTVFIKKDDSNYVEPDVSVICNTELISDRGCEGAPVLVIEVVSPSSRRMDYNIKNALYSSVDVREYWIVDPAVALIIVPIYTPTHRGNMIHQIFVLNKSSYLNIFYISTFWKCATSPKLFPSIRAFLRCPQDQHTSTTRADFRFFVSNCNWNVS